MSQRQIIFISGADQAELGDDALGHRIAGGEPAQQRAVEDRPIAGSDYVVRLIHGNKVNTFAWTVERDHGTAAAAVAFMRDHADDIPAPPGLAAGILQETGDDGSIRFLQACAIVTVECARWDGQTSIYKYTARGGAWTDVINPV